jgi:serine/threonine protein kinase
MAEERQYKVQQKVGPWTLVEYFATGGNGEVWRAVDPAGGEVALKILLKRDSTHVRYKRFRDEIEILLQLGSQPGILPLVDRSLPENPSKQSPAWLAMPLAIPLSDALGSSPALETVVEAVACVAETLATLAARGISHRDIKPDNLYRYQDGWAVGDFGLVDYPNKEQFTTDSRQLGPLYFHAPEMLEDPVHAKGPPADVYSLAKTLYVLATGQRYPPPGQQRVTSPMETMAVWLPHPRVRSLDVLCERATAKDPNLRLTMQEVARELRAWLTPRRDPQVPDDLEDVATHVASLIEKSNTAVEQQRALARRILPLLNELEVRLQPLAKTMARVLRSACDGRVHRDKTVLNAHGYVLGMGEPDIIAGEGLCFVAGSPKGDVTMWGGVGVQLLEDGKVYLSAAYLARTVYEDLHNVVDGLYFLEVFPIDSAQQEHAIDAAVETLSKNLAEAAREFGSLLVSVQ